MALIDPGTRKWLMTEYGVSEFDNGKTVPRAQKHALVIRECKCGRKIAGNVYFRHVRHCSRSPGGILDQSQYPSLDLSHFALGRL